MNRIQLLETVKVGSGLAIAVHYNYPGRKTSKARLETPAQFCVSFVDTHGSERPSDWTQESKVSLRVAASSGSSSRLNAWLTRRRLGDYIDQVIEKQSLLTQSAVRQLTASK